MINENNFYNLAKWNGQTWEIQQIQFPIYDYHCESPIYYPNEISTIYLLPSGKILLCDYSNIALLDGTTITHYPCLPRNQSTGGINKIWAISETDFYCVGGKGDVQHYNNGTWQKLNSGTTLDFEDIWGAKNLNTGNDEILAIATETNGAGSVLFLINGETVSPISWMNMPRSINSVWFVPGKKYYVVGDGIFINDNPYTHPQWKEDPRSRFFTYYRRAIRANGRNDIAVACDYGDILHYNGLTWESYYRDTKMDGVYYKVDIKDNLIIAVGEVDNRGIIAVGKRQ